MINLFIFIIQLIQKYIYIHLYIYILNLIDIYNLYRNSIK